jgi:glutamate:GABA antiporter
MTNGLRRAMSFRDVVLFFVVAVVSPRWIATAAAAGPGALVVWIVAALTLFVPLSLAVIELSSRHPEEGGLYVWTGRAFGPFAGFLSAWMYWASNVIYLPGLLYFAAANLLFAGDASWRGLADDPSWYVSVSLVGIAIGIGLNVRGLGWSTRLHNLGAIATWVTFVILLVLGIACWVRFGPGTALAPAPPAHGLRLADVFFWSTIAFAFGGVEAASLMGGEIENARRTVPRAVLASALVIAGIYVAGTAAVLVAIPAGEVSGLQGILQAIERMAARTGFQAIVPVAALLIAFGALAGASAWLAATARLPLVAGVDRFLPAAFAEVHPRWGTPVAALVTQGVLAAAVALLGQAGSTVRGAYDVLVGMGVITYFIPFLFLFAAHIRLQGEPAREGAFRIPGGRPVAVAAAAVGFASTALSAVLAAFPPGDGQPWLAAAKVVGGSAFLAALGAVLYLRGKRRA